MKSENIFQYVSNLEARLAEAEANAKHCALHHEVAGKDKCHYRADRDRLAAQVAELTRERDALRKAMLSALEATRAKLNGDEDTDFICMGADEIRIHIGKLKADLAAERERAEKAEDELREHNPAHWHALAATLRIEAGEARAEAERLTERNARLVALLLELRVHLYAPAAVQYRERIDAALAENAPTPTDHQAPASGALVHPVVGQTEPQETK